MDAFTCHPVLHDFGKFVPDKRFVDDRRGRETFMHRIARRGHEKNSRPAFCSYRRNCIEAAAGIEINIAGDKIGGESMRRINGLAFAARAKYRVETEFAQRDADRQRDDEIVFNDEQVHSITFDPKVGLAPVSPKNCRIDEPTAMIQIRFQKDGY